MQLTDGDFRDASPLRSELGKLTREQQAAFRAVVLEAFEPDLMTPDRPFRRSIACQTGGWAPRAVRDDLESRWASDVQLRPGT